MLKGGQDTPDKVYALEVSTPNVGRTDGRTHFKPLRREVQES